MAGFKLPPQDHPARESFDMPTLVALLDPANVDKLLTTRQARYAAQAVMTSDKAIRALCYVVLRCDDERWLISVGRRGGWKKLWNFGNGRD